MQRRGRRGRIGRRDEGSGFEIFVDECPIVPNAKLTRDFQTTLNTPDVHRKLTQLGFEVMATDGPGVERHARQEYERWGTFVRSTNLKLDE